MSSDQPAPTGRWVQPDAIPDGVLRLGHLNEGQQPPTMPRNALVGVPAYVNGGRIGHITATRIVAGGLWIYEVELDDGDATNTVQRGNPA